MGEHRRAPASAEAALARAPAGAGGAGGAGGETPGVPAYGRFGQATTTFTLPEPAPKEGERPAIAYPDLTESFPEVDCPP
ncbi:hypothetical protein [Sorangium sp. So ce176]|uniref:hypothetical protein n=1 Tax=Sorangium sp. So ce176 TaxID=3133286 RepID=UPI003F644A1F